MYVGLWFDLWRKGCFGLVMICNEVDGKYCIYALTAVNINFLRNTYIGIKYHYYIRIINYKYI